MSTEFPQQFAISTARLTAPSLYALLGNLHEFQLQVLGGGIGILIGDGYQQDVAYAFTRLIYDWVAVTHLRVPADLEEGVYMLGGGPEAYFVRTEAGQVPLVDGPAEVTLVVAEAEE